MEEHFESVQFFPFGEGDPYQRRVPAYIAAFLEDHREENVGGWVLKRKSLSRLSDFEVWVGGRDRIASLLLPGSRYWVSVDQHSLDCDRVRGFPDSSWELGQDEIWMVSFVSVEEEGLLEAGGQDFVAVVICYKIAEEG